MVKLLIIEDDRFLASAYRVKFTKAGFDVRMASDGQEGLTALSQFHPDAVILDLVMPVKDGFTVLAEMKSSPDFRNIPVIVTSNLSQKEDIDKVKGLGAVDFVVKSDVSLDSVVAKVKAVVHPIGS